MKNDEVQSTMVTTVMTIIVLVMTALRGILDFVYQLPFLFSLYYNPEPSGMLYDDAHTISMTHTPDHSSMM